MRLTDEELSLSIKQLVDGFMATGVTSPQSPNAQNVLANVMNYCAHLLAVNVGVPSTNRVLYNMASELEHSLAEMMRNQARREAGTGGIPNETD